MPKRSLYLSLEKEIYFNMLDIDKPRVIPDRSDWTSIIIIKLQFKFRASEASILEWAFPSLTNNSN